VSNTANSNVDNPSHQEISEQLHRILKDDDFERSPKISKFLHFVVSETLSGKKNYIKAHTVAVSVFEKDEKFDPQLDPLVRVNAVRLRRMLSQYYALEGSDDAVIIEIPKGSYVPIFHFRNSLNGEENNLMRQSARADSSFPTIAVRNFKNLSKDLEYTNIANGITLEIISNLYKFKELTVIARSAANLTEDKLINPMHLKQIVDVQYVLSGSVYIDNENIRINVALDDTISNTNIWANTYTEKLSLKSLLTIQDEIIRHTATTIAQPFGVIIRKELVKLDKKTTDNLNAYENYLHYYQFILSLSPKDHLKARDALERAVEIDPQFSDAWAALAIIYAMEYQLSMNQMKREVHAKDLAYQTARNALKISPDNSRARYAVFYADMVNNNLEDCKTFAEQALKLNPNNPLMLADYGLHLAFSGNWEEGLEKLKYAAVLNPAHPDFYYFPFVLDYYRRDKYREALDEAQNIHMPEYFWTHVFLAVIYSALGDAAKAQFAVKELTMIYPNINEKLRFELEKWNIQPELIQKMIQGLEFAGLRVI